MIVQLNTQLNKALSRIGCSAEYYTICRYSNRFACAYNRLQQNLEQLASS